MRSRLKTFTALLCSPPGTAVMVRVTRSHARRGRNARFCFPLPQRGSEGIQFSDERLDIRLTVLSSEKGVVLAPKRSVLSVRPHDGGHCIHQRLIPRLRQGLADTGPEFPAELQHIA